jgi:hypothetical protein
MKNDKHVNALNTIGEINYHILSRPTKEEIGKVKPIFNKYRKWENTNGSQDNKILGGIAKKIILELGIIGNWPENSLTPYLCFLVDMNKNKNGWEWKLKPGFCDFIDGI